MRNEKRGYKLRKCTTNATTNAKKQKCRSVSNRAKALLTLKNTENQKDMIKCKGKK